MIDTVKRVRELMDAKNISFYQLSQTTGISPGTFSHAEKRGGQLTLTTIDRICGALNITLSEFFAEKDTEA